MEPKRFIGNDMTRLYEKVRREFGPDAVIVRTRTLLRDGADPLIEILAAPPEAEKELRKIPFFVRGKARRNTETYARDKGLPVITLETLYDAKAHFSR